MSGREKTAPDCRAQLFSARAAFFAWSHAMRPLLLAAVLFAFALPRASAWDYEGHRAVNLAAIASLPPEFPAFVKADAARERIGFLAGEPDRWRNVPQDLPLKHASSPDHFIDFEDLTPLDLSAATVSDFRYVYTAQIFAARAAHPHRFPVIDPEKNKDHTRELPGYLPWTITEYYARLKSAFSYLKAYEENGTPEEIANAQANVIYLMGVMGHYVGDGAQPLHTTKHYNGWVGENPHGYTTARTFHSWIDGGFLGKSGGLSRDHLEQRVKPAARLSTVAGPSGRDPVFEHSMHYLLAQFALVEPLYVLEKDGKLTSDNPSSKEGLAFLENQILNASQMLGSLWLTAWQEAPPDTYLRGHLLARQAKLAK
jgi:hypothetical protein